MRTDNNGFMAYSCLDNQFSWSVMFRSQIYKGRSAFLKRQVTKNSTQFVRPKILAVVCSVFGDVLWDGIQEILQSIFARCFIRIDAEIIAEWLIVAVQYSVVDNVQPETVSFFNYLQNWWQTNIEFTVYGSWENSRRGQVTVYLYRVAEAERVC